MAWFGPLGKAKRERSRWPKLPPLGGTLATYAILWYKCLILIWNELVLFFSVIRDFFAISNQFKKNCMLLCDFCANLDVAKVTPTGSKLPRSSQEIHSIPPKGLKHTKNLVVGMILSLSFNWVWKFFDIQNFWLFSGPPNWDNDKNKEKWSNWPKFTNIPTSSSQNKAEYRNQKKNYSIEWKNGMRSYHKPIFGLSG